MIVFDITKAEKKIVKAVQAQSLPVETDKTVTTGQLARFEDEGILHVVRRLKHSELLYDTKSPMILPGKHQVTGLIFLHYHVSILYTVCSVPIIFAANHSDHLVIQMFLRCSSFCKLNVRLLG